MQALRTLNFGALLAAVAFGFLVRPAQAQKKIPTGKDVYTHQQFCREHLEYLRQDIETYRKLTKDKPEVQDLAIKFLQEFNKQLVQHPDRIKKAEVHALGQKVVEAGTNDILILSCIVKTRIWAREEGADHSVGSVYDRSEDMHRYGRRQMPRFRRWSLESYGMAAWKKDTAAVLARYAIPEMMAWLKEEKNISKHRRFVWKEVSKLMDQLPSAERERMHRDYRAIPGADLWLVEMIAGYHHLRRAKEYRGQGYRIHQAEWKSGGFEKHIEDAGAHLRKAITIDDSHPHPTAYLIDVSAAKGDELPPREWFDRSVAIQMDFLPAYHSMLEALAPRFDGSPSKQYQFGVECLDTKRFDTYVPTILITALIKIEEGKGKSDDAWTRRGVYRKLKECFDGLMSHPSKMDRDFYRSWHAAIAIKVGQYEDARKRFDELKENVSERPFSTLGLKSQPARARVYALTGAAGEVVSQIEEVLAHGMPDTAFKTVQLEALLDSAVGWNDQPLAAPFFDQLRRQSTFLKKFHSDEWIDLPFDKALTGWQKVFGNWQADGKGGVILSPESPRPARKSHRIEFFSPIESPYEIEVDLEWIGPKRRFFGGIAIGNVNDSTEGRFFITSDKMVGISYYNEVHVTWERGLPSLKKRLHVRAWPKSYEMSIDDVWFYREVDQQFVPSSGLALASLPDKTVECKIRFSNLRVRKLIDSAPPSKYSGTESEKYYTDRLERTPSDMAAHYYRGIARFRLKQYDLARSDLEKLFAGGRKMNNYYTDVGRCYHRQGKWKEALDWYEKGAYATNHAPLRTFCSALLVLCAAPDDKIRNQAQADKIIQRFVRQQGRYSWRYQEAYAMYCAERGEFDKAVKAAEIVLRDNLYGNLNEAKRRLELYRKKQPLRLVVEKSKK